MLNLIKMDLYRMFRSVSTWVILIFTVGIAAFCVTMANMDVDAMAEDPQYAQESAEEIAAGNSASDTDMSNADRQIGIYAESDPAWVSGEIDAGELISTQMTSGMLTLLCVIFAAIFGSAEQKNGYIKNIAGQLPNRGVLAVSKLAVSAVQVFLMTVIFVVSTGVMGKLFWGERFAVGAVSDMLPFLGAQYLLNVGFAALIIFLCTLTKSSAFGMTAGILMVLGLSVPVYSLINRAVAELAPSWKFDISRFMPDGNIWMAGIGSSSEVLIRAAAVGAAFAVICTALAMITVKKRDVR